jgi:chromosome segregation ATPase
MDSSTEFEMGLLRSQLMRQRVLLAVVAIVAIGALGWNLAQGRSGGARGARLRHVTAAVDRLDRAVATQRSRFAPLEQRVITVRSTDAQMLRRLGSKVDRTTVSALQDRIDDLAARLDRHDSLMVRLQGELERQTRDAAAARDDSLAMLRGAIDSRIAAIGEDARRNRNELHAIRQDVESLQDAAAHGHKWTAVRDAATVTALAMITAHVAGGDR